MTDTKDNPSEIDDATSDYLAKYAAREKLHAELQPLNKDALFRALSAAGITHVIVSFDGYGDSGQIQDIEAKAGDEAVALPDVEIDIGIAECGKTDPIRCRAKLSDAVEGIAYDLLDQEHSGWENGEGAYGDFTFDVAKRTITLSYNARFVDSEHFEHVL